MTKRHTRAWHQVHDAALAERASERANQARAEDAAPLDALAAPPPEPLPEGYTTSPATGRHVERAAQQAYRRQTGNYDD